MAVPPFTYLISYLSFLKKILCTIFRRLNHVHTFWGYIFALFLRKFLGLEFTSQGVLRVLFCLMYTARVPLLPTHPCTNLSSKLEFVKSCLSEFLLEKCFLRGRVFTEGIFLS